MRQAREQSAGECSGDARAVLVLYEIELAVRPETREEAVGLREFVRPIGALLENPRISRLAEVNAGRAAIGLEEALCIRGLVKDDGAIAQPLERDLPRHGPANAECSGRMTLR